MTTTNDAAQAAPEPAGAKSKPKRAPKPGRWNVLVFHDDMTPRSFVVKDVLVPIFGYAPDKADAVAGAIEKAGSGIVGTYGRDIASTKATETRTAAATEGWPLACEARPEDDGSKGMMP